MSKRAPLRRVRTAPAVSRRLAPPARLSFRSLRFEPLEVRNLLTVLNLTVNTTADALDTTTLGDGHVDVDPGTPGDQVSLRGAIQEANAAFFKDVVITLPAGHFDLLLTAGAQDDIFGDLDITQTTGSVTINGAGAGSTIIDADGIDRVFEFYFGSHVTLSNLTVTGGQGFEEGGGILNQGTLDLEQVAVVNNAVDGNLPSDFGGIGGGVANFGSLTANLSRIADNTAHSSANDGGYGGGIYNEGDVTLTQSFLGFNVAEDGSSSGVGTGGAIDTEWGNVVVENSTISGNQAGQASAINAGDASDFVQLLNCTIADNIVTGAAPAFYVTGGADMLLLDSILYHNYLLSDPSTVNEIVGALDANSGFNLIDTDNPGLDLGLAAFADDGAFGAGYDLLPGSPALDTGHIFNPATIDRDQRGYLRVAPSTVGGANLLDIGAHEYDVPAPPSVLSIVRTSPAGGVLHSNRPVYTVTFSESVSGVDASDFAVATSQYGGILGVTEVNPWTYTVLLAVDSTTYIPSTVNFRLELTDNDSIVDADNVPLGGVGFGFDSSNQPLPGDGSANGANETYIPVGPRFASSINPPSLVDVGKSITFNPLDFAADYTGTIDPSTLTLTSPPEYGTVSIDPSTGEITYFATDDNDSSVTVQMSVADDNGDIAYFYFYIGFNPLVIDVTTTDDLEDLTPLGDGHVDVDLSAPGEQISLRGAIEEANKFHGLIVINLPAGHYDLTALNSSTNAALGQLLIQGTVAINGAGAASTIIDGMGLDHVFNIDFSSYVTISSLTITGGASADGGGGIANRGNTTLSDCIVTNNVALASAPSDSSGIGGGILNDGVLVVLFTSITNNTAQGSTSKGGLGGGIYNDGDLTIMNSFVGSNIAENGVDSGDGVGGGIDAERGSPYGGSESGRMFIGNTTFSANHAAQGSAVFAVAGDSNNKVLIVNATIADNVASRANGAGVFVKSGAHVQINNTIFNNNHIDIPGDSGILEIEGTIDPASGNNFVDTDHPLSYDPGLGPLADNGGPTLTYALLPGSPLIDQGDNAAVEDLPTTAAASDQRKQSRIVGPFLHQFGTVDIGAYELQQYPQLYGIDRTTPPDQNTSASSITYTVTFSEPVTGVDASDFTVITDTTTNVVTYASPIVVSGSGAVYTVTINGIVSTAIVTWFGFIALDLVDNDTIVDANLNPLGGVGFGADSLGNPVLGDNSYGGQAYFITKDGPHGIADSASTPPGQQITIDVLSNDLDSTGTIAPTTVVIVTPPVHGLVSVDPVTGAITYTAADDYSGADPFTYQVSDDNGDTSAAIAVNLNVTDLVLIVNTEIDAVDDTPLGDGHVDIDPVTPGDQISLRAAIQESNAYHGGVTIILPAGQYHLTLTSGSADDSFRDLDITKTDGILTIEGDEAIDTIVDADGNDRVLEVYLSAVALISGVTFTGGDGAKVGGGILNAGDLSLDSSIVTDNAAAPDLPNSTGGLGGGIANSGTLYVTETQITNNQARSSAHFAGHGGGVMNTGTMTLLSSFVGSNEAADGDVDGDGTGGGVDTETGSAYLENSTFSGNQAAQGSAVYAGDPSVNVTILNCTIADNVAEVSGGAGIFIVSGADLLLLNTLLANNYSTFSGLFDIIEINGSLDIASKNNLIDTDDLSLDLGLGPLGDNGCLTPTYALLSGSPAIDAGDFISASGLSTDQRGSPRFVDGTQSGHAEVDIGAFEFQPFPYVQSILRDTPASSTTSATSVTYTISFSAPVSGVDATDFVVGLSGSVTTSLPVVVNDTGMEYSNTITVTINGIFGNGDVTLTLVDDDTIVDENNSPLGGVGFGFSGGFPLAGDGSFTGDTYTIVQSGPTALPDDVELEANTSTLIPVLNNDTDSIGNIDPTTVILVDPPAHGHVFVDFTTGVITYTPDPNFAGSDSFSYQFTDDLGMDSAPGTVSIDVTVPLTQLSTGTGPAGLTMLVDGYGSFGSNVFSQDANAFYQPVDAPSAAGTTLQSGLAIQLAGSSTRDFLTGGYIAGSSGLPVAPFTDQAPTAGTSTFTYDSLSFTLTQTVSYVYDSNHVAIGSILTQTYLVKNLGSSTQDFELLRYLNGDLRFDGTSVDGGGRITTAAGDVLFETDSGGTGATSTSFVGINATGGTTPGAGRYEIENYAQLVQQLVQGSALANTIDGDADADQFIDPGSAYNVALALRNLFSLAPNASATYQTQTMFGSGPPADANVSPLANNDVAVTIVDLPIQVDVLSNDIDADGSIDPTTVTILTDAQHGSTAIDPVTGAITYTPDFGYFGPDSFTYKVRDNSGADSNVATVPVRVNALPYNNLTTGSPTTNEEVAVAISGIEVGDPDPTVTSLSTSLHVDHGTLTVDASVPGVVVTGNGSSLVTIFGTVGQINATLAKPTKVQYTPSLNYYGPETLKIVTTDIGPAAAGSIAPVAAVDTVDINVQPVNDAPINTLPAGPLSTNEDTALVLSGISVADVDAADMTVTFNVLHGKLTVDTSVAGVVVVGNGTNSMTISGTLAAINAMLALSTGLTYTPGQDYSGQDSLFMNSDDFGETGAGESLQDDDVLPLVVFPVNDAPINTVPVGPLSTNEDTARSITGLAIADVDAGSSPVSTTFQVTHGTLSFAATAPGVTLLGSGTSVVQLLGTISQINATLALPGGITYTPTADYNGPDSLDMVTNDQGASGLGGSQQDSDSVTLNVVSINDPPEGADNTVTTLEDNAYVFAIADFGFADPHDNPANALQDVHFVSLPAVGVLSNNGIPIVIGQFVPVADIAAGKLRFTPVANSNGNNYASFGFVVRDNGGTANGGKNADQTPNTITINVTAVDDAPVNTLPAGPLSTLEDTALPITGLAIVDIDAGSAVVSATFQVAHGTLNVGSFSPGVTVLGNGTSSLQYIGTISQINAALGVPNGIVYTPSQDYNGPDTLSMVTDDQGASGLSGPQQDSDFAAINVVAVNDPPVNTLPGGPLSTPKDTALKISGISVSDVDAGSAPLTTTFQVVHGTLSVDASLSGALVAGGGTATLTITGTLSQINATLATATGLSYLPEAGYDGPDSLSMVTDDGGATGLGGAQQDTDNVAINIGALSFILPTGPLTTNEDISRMISGVSISDPDAGSSLLTAVVSVTHGTLVVGVTQGDEILDGNGTNTLTIIGTLSQINFTLTTGLVYKPDPDYNGPDTLSATVFDSGTGLQANASVALEATPVNDKPVNALTTAPLTVNEDGSLSILDISIDDVDVGSAILKTTFQITHGTLNVGASVPGVIISGNDTNSVTLTGTLSQINATLALATGLTYTPDPNYNGSATLEMTTDDQGATGSGGPQHDYDRRIITVGPANDPPVNTLPNGPLTTNEDTALVISGISINDVDAGSAPVFTSFQVTHGKLTVGTSVPGAIVAGNGTNFVTITGTLSQINATLALATGLTYLPDHDYNGPDSLSMVTDDQGATGIGGAQQDSDNVAINIVAVNDAPVNTLPAGPLSTNEEAALAIGGISIADVDAGSAVMSTQFQVTHGTLSVGTSVPGVIVTGNGTGTVTITGTISQINSTLALSTKLTYTPTLNYDGPDLLTMVTSDGGATGTGGSKQDSDSVPINVNGVNDAPVNTIPLGPLSTNEDTALHITTLAIADVDAGSATVVLDLEVFAGTLHVGTSVPGVSIFGNDTDFLEITGTVSQINATLALSGGLTYTPAPDFNGFDTLFMDTSDGGASGSGGPLDTFDSVDINIIAVNDAPVNLPPSGPLTTNEDTTLHISGISVSDVDASTSSLRTTFQVTHGTLNVGTSVSGVTITGNNTSTLVITGTLLQINATLALSGGLSYTPTLNYNGPDSLSMVTSDQGATGIGGAQQDSDNVAINIVAVNDAPVNTLPAGPLSTNEDAALAIGGISIADVDAGSAVVSTQFQVTHGTLSVGTSVPGVIVTGNGTGAVTITGTISQINSTLALSTKLTYTPTLNYNGPDLLTMVTSDGGATGTGGSKQDSDSVPINVNGVNDAPVNTIPLGPLSTNEDTALHITTLAIADVDAGSAVMVLDLLVFAGTLHVGTSVPGASIFGNDTDFLEITGTVSQINATLALSGGLTYTPAPDFNGFDTLFMDTSDGGASGSGGPLDAFDSVDINIIAVNDAPVNTLPPGPLTVTEDTALPVTGLSIADIDADSATVRTTFQVAHGTLAFGSVAPGVTLLGSGTNSVQILGTVDQINATLALPNGLIYTPTLNYNGPDSLSMVTDDQGATGIGGAQQDSDNVAINIVAVNDAPVNTLPAGPLSTHEDMALVIGGISIADVDAGSTVVVAQFQVTYGKLSVDSSLSGVNVDGNGTGTLSIVGTISQINATLALPTGLTYLPDPGFNGPDTLKLDTNDLGASGAGGPQKDTDTASINVLPVNNPPTGADNTVTTPEDIGYTFTIADFGFADPIDNPHNNLLGVTITTLPGAGTLTINGNSVIAGESVSAGDISSGGLVFTPAPNGNGVPYTSFTFQVQDDGGTVNGGQDTDQTPKTLRINVTSVNDAPVNTLPSLPLSTNEDTALAIAGIVVNDVDAGSSLLTTQFQVAHGTLSVGASVLGVNVDGNNTNSITITGTLSQINAMLALSSGLTYTPDHNYNGPDTLFMTTTDAGSGLTLPLSTTDQIAINILSVNDAPAGADNIVTTREDNDYVFTTGDFGFSDPDDSPANGLQDVHFVSLPAVGVLSNNGLPVFIGQFISAADIAAGKLKFTPVANANGNNYASFGFVVRDDGGTANGGKNIDQTPNTITINVSSVNDEPAGADKTVTTNENNDYIFTTSDFGFVDTNDSPANLLLDVRITSLPAAGTLSNNGIPVVAGQAIAAADIAVGSLKFTPGLNANGSNYASFTFRVQDDGGLGNGGQDTDQTDNKITINVTSVNNEPTGADNAVNTLEDNDYVFTSSDFGFADPNDSPANAFAGILIGALPAAGTLLDNGVPVAAGQFVSAADIALGRFSFSPAANANGANYASFTFQVRDDGGSVNGGVNTDQSPNTMTVNVTPLNDEPVGADRTVTTLEDHDYVFVTSDFGYADPNDSPANALAGVVITALPAAGTLIDNGIPVVAGQFVSAADIAIGLLKFRPAANANGANYASFTFQVRDDGGIANGGVNTDQSPNTIKINVTSINDEPSGADKTVTTPEDHDYVFATADFGFSDPSDSPANALAGLLIGALPAAGTLSDNGIPVATGQFVSAADIALGLLKFHPAADANGSNYASFAFQVRDDGGTANSGKNTDSSPNIVTISVSAVNDAPVSTLPSGPLSVTAGTALVIPGITVADVDAGLAQLITTFHVSHGTLSVDPSISGVTVDGNGTANVTISGSISQINATLAQSTGLTYMPDSTYSGPDLLTMDTDDQGATGSGGPQHGTDSVTINVAPLIVPPVVQSIARTTPTSAISAGPSVEYIVTFSKPVTGVDASDFSVALTGTATAGTPVVVTGAGAVYTVTVNGVTGSGTLRLDLNDNDTIVDAGNHPLGGVGFGNNYLGTPAVGDGSLKGDVYSIGKANDDTALTYGNAPVEIIILTNDTVAFSSPEAVIVTQPSHGTIVVDPIGGTIGPRITYTPTAGYIGPDTIQYQLKDSQNNVTNVATITIDDREGFTVIPYDPADPKSILTNALLAPSSGLSIVDVQYTGSNGQGGIYTGYKFQDGTNSTSLPNGVILTTGEASNALGADDEASISKIWSSSGNPDLDKLIGASVTHDTNTLTIRFTAASDIQSVLFSFAFGSEEFPRFVGKYNDVFGAFLDGQPISFDTSGKPVSVNNNFFVYDNTGHLFDGQTYPARDGKTLVDYFIQYNGLTSALGTLAPLDASLAVHTLTFSIADGNDSALDSAVLIGRLLGTQLKIKDPITNDYPIPVTGGPYTVPSGGTVQFIGNAIPDPGQVNPVITYTWDLDGDGTFGESGPQATRGNESGPTPIFSAVGLSPGTYIVTLKVVDATGASNTASVPVVVTGKAPVAMDDSAVVSQNAAQFMNVLANDLDELTIIDATSLRIIRRPEHGTVSVDPQSGMITYQSDPGYSGPDSFTYRVADNLRSMSNEATVTIMVQSPTIITTNEHTQNIGTTSQPQPVLPYFAPPIIFGEFAFDPRTFLTNVDPLVRNNVGVGSAPTVPPLGPRDMPRVPRAAPQQEETEQTIFNTLSYGDPTADIAELSDETPSLAKPKPPPALAAAELSIGLRPEVPLEPEEETAEVPTTPFPYAQVTAAAALVGSVLAWLGIWLLRHVGSGPGLVLGWKVLSRTSNRLKARDKLPAGFEPPSIDRHRDESHIDMIDNL